MGRKNRIGTDGSGLIRKSTSLLLFGICILISGCHNSERTWSAEAKSPDGKFIATARTIAPGGWGTGSAPETTVDLNWTTGSQGSAQILAFFDGPDEPGGMNVGMTWLTPSHLELTYKGHPTFDFQAVKCRGVDITLRNPSSVPSSSLP
jgi:hypothetical protein